MINLVELSVLAEEYQKEAESLLSNAAYVANHKKDTWAQIKAAYETLAGKFDGMQPDTRAKTKVLYQVVDELKQLIRKPLKDEDDVSAQWAAELGLKKIEALEALLHKIEVEVIVKVQEIIFRHKGHDVLMLPLRQIFDESIQ